MRIKTLIISFNFCFVKDIDLTHRLKEKTKKIFWNVFSKFWKPKGQCFLFSAASFPMTAADVIPHGLTNHGKSSPNKFDKNCYKIENIINLNIKVYYNLMFNYI